MINIIERRDRNIEEKKINLNKNLNSIIDIDSFEITESVRDNLMIEVDKEQKIIKYNIVKSDADKVNLFDLFLDLETGYYLMGCRKKDKYIPFFNFYQYLKDMGYKFDNKIMRGIVERYKLNSKVEYNKERIEYFMKLLQKYGYKEESMISKLILNEEENNLNKNVISDMSSGFEEILNNSIDSFDIEYIIKYYIDIYDFYMDFYYTLVQYNYKLEINFSDKIQIWLYNLYDILEEKDLDLVLDYMIYTDKYKGYKKIINMVNADKYIKCKKLKSKDIRPKVMKLVTGSIEVGDKSAIINDFRLLGDEMIRGADRIERMINKS